jgi:small conductance mechanosensitive channel
VTVLRAADQRVVVVQNSSCQRLVNHTKIRSGIDVVLPLAVTNADLPGALAVIGAELELFANDPLWSLEQMAPPLLRGVNGVGPLGIQVSVMLTTRTGRQWACQRELLARLITRLQREGIALAGAPAAVPLPS